jgi:hypothetical protein
MRKTAQFSRRIDDHARSHRNRRSGYLKSRFRPRDRRYETTFFDGCTSGDHTIKNVPGNSESGAIKRNRDLRGTGANPCRMDSGCACAHNVIEHTELFKTVDCACRHETAADFWTWKMVPLKSNSINASPNEFTNACGPAEASSDDNHIVLSHFCATKTSR